MLIGTPVEENHPVVRPSQSRERSVWNWGALTWYICRVVFSLQCT